MVHIMKISLIMKSIFYYEILQLKATSIINFTEYSRFKFRSNSLIISSKSKRIIDFLYFSTVTDIFQFHFAIILLNLNLKD